MQPFPPERAVAQKIGIVPREPEVHAQKVQHGACQFRPFFVQRDHGYFLPALAGGGFQPAYAVDDRAVRRGYDGQMNAEARQHPAHISGMTHEAGHVAPGKRRDFPHLSGHAGEECRAVRGNVRQFFGQGMNVSPAQGRAHVPFGVLYGYIIGSPVEQDIDAATPFFRHVHTQHGHAGGSHVHGHGVPLMAGENFPVRSRHQRQQEAQLAQGKPHQFQAFRVGLAGIIQGGTQGGNGQQFNSVHTPASAGFRP